MPPVKVPNDDHIMRYARKKLLRRDEEGNVLGILPQALELRTNETYLSVTWLEHFNSIYEEGFVQAAEAIRRQLEVKPKDGFSVAHLEQFCAICDSKETQIRIVHEPDGEENTGHVAIRRFPRDDLELLDLLAADAFVDTRVSGQV